MLKTIFTFFVALNGTLFLSAQETKDTIVWNSRNQLRFEDFIGNPPTNPTDSNYYHGHAEIATTIVYKINLQGGKPTIVANAIAIRTKSWMIKKTADVLLHEQTHFDIAEIYARKLEATVNAQSSTLSIVDFLHFLNTRVEIIGKELSIEQERFDKYWMIGVAMKYYTPMIDSCLGK